MSNKEKFKLFLIGFGKVLSMFLIFAVIATIVLVSANSSLFELRDKREEQSTTITTSVNDDTSTTEETPELVMAELVRVVDGDTIIVKKGTDEVRVRLIGVDTPESVSPNEEENCKEGKLASKYTSSLLKEGQTLYLEYDKDTKDKYGRDLCYVWLNEDTSDLNNMLNYVLLRDGCAEAFFFTENNAPFNQKHLYDFNQAEKEAKDNNAGLWNTGVFE